MNIRLALIIVIISCQFAFAQKFEDGPFKTYYKSGELKSEGNYVDSKRDGKWVDYYKSGQISKIHNYDKGKFLPNSISYFEDGTVSYEIKKEGENDVAFGYYESGNLKYKRQLKRGFYKEFTEDGRLKIEANYEKSDLYGVWKLYHDNGNIAWEVNYFNGYRNGGYKQYYDNGQLKLEGVMIKEKKKGEEKRYTEEGHLEWKGYYDNDEFDKTWIRYNASKKKVEKIKFREGVAVNTDQTVSLEPTLVPDGVIEKVPLYPGCEYVYGNKDRKTCMSQAISKFVGTHFNTGIAVKNGLKGRHRIYVIFKIGKEGEVFNVQARGPHPALEQEAIRVIKLMPKLQPGFQKGKPVIVPYSLPILFQVQ
ncbi:energy transducer TonB [Psychroserpens sp. SPM9]|uniref:energy transducer TonB n=1 Tax=Psychroserpens sp. SPM9 TaxID=2975598 RepID=UPI0021A6B84C|nr:energy transducer TonB [Psychroserpens sp. SPM9]MDG5492865.1 energy transducer TonB [Psychroserpens sp. SPM9]